MKSVYDFVYKLEVNGMSYATVNSETCLRRKIYANGLDEERWGGC